MCVFGRFFGVTRCLRRHPLTTDVLPGRRTLALESGSSFTVTQNNE